MERDYKPRNAKQSLEAEKSKKIDSALEPSERNTALLEFGPVRSVR